MQGAPFQLKNSDSLRFVSYQDKESDVLINTSQPCVGEKEVEINREMLKWGSSSDGVFL